MEFPSAVVENAEAAHVGEPVGRDFKARLEIVVVVVRNRQEGDAGLTRTLHGGEDVVGRQRDLLVTRAAEGVEEARHAGLAAIGNVERNAERAIGAAQRRERNAPCGSAISTAASGLRPSTVL